MVVWRFACADDPERHVPQLARRCKWKESESSEVAANQKSEWIMRAAVKAKQIFGFHEILMWKFLTSWRTVNFWERAVLDGVSYVDILLILLDR